ncbi:MAG: RHS repeat-associated core domain-containing protein, partial [Defluviitaleaceae bacterium]|nr:RHS repeat-associated core domain-containing protein [Defluviitaleaceae bacterium]
DNIQRQTVISQWGTWTRYFSDTTQANILFAYQYDAFGNLINPFDPTGGAGQNNNNNNNNNNSNNNTNNSNNNNQTCQAYEDWHDRLEDNTNPFRFSGVYYDWSTGTYYLRARQFNPRTGRFTQADPFWSVGNMQTNNLSILQSGNLFVFGMNNPVRWIDPSGMVVTPWDRMFLPREAVRTLEILSQRWHDPNASQVERDVAAAQARAIRAPHLIAGEVQLCNGYILQQSNQTVVATGSFFLPSATLSYERLWASSGLYIRMTNVSGNVNLDGGFDVLIHGSFAQGNTRPDFYHWFWTSQRSFSFDVNTPFIRDTGSDLSTATGLSITFDIMGRGMHEVVHIVNKIYWTEHSVNGNLVLGLPSGTDVLREVMQDDRFWDNLMRGLRR